jgi:hypothetical protein
MQFTIRTLFIITFIVALFCSATVTFQGQSRYYAIVILAWILLAGAYLSFRNLRSAIIPHILGLIVALMIWPLCILDKSLLFWSDRLELLPPFILIGLFVGIIVGLTYTIVLKTRNTKKE